MSKKKEKMTKRRLNLRKVATIACLAGITVFSGCEKPEDDPNDDNGKGKPEAVMNLTATAGNGQVSLSWDAPSEDGGSEITGYEVTMDNWANNVSKSASERTHTYTVLTNGTEYTFKVRALNANGAGAESTAKATPTASGGEVPDGVLIGGVVWATRNIAAPGNFTDNPEDVGMYYQYNRKVGYNNSGNGWDDSFPTGTEWARENDPSPTGWRLPTLEEYAILYNKVEVTHEYATVNGINGKKITCKETGKSIFLPFAGYLNPADGSLKSSIDGFYGFNCTRSAGNDVSASYIEITSYSMLLKGGTSNMGWLLRSVKE